MSTSTSSPAAPIPAETPPDPTPYALHGCELAPPYLHPPMRRLRVYAFDPQASKDLETSVVNDAVISLPWEAPWEQPIAPGPRNDYIEVIDHDPASGLFYAPVDLNDPDLLAQNGLPPSEGRPQFHQQMAFTVAMRTVRLFERALGRTVMWARERPPWLGRSRPRNAANDREFVTRLRIYPHALREANAYYSPQKTALLFGYFRPPESDKSGDEWVFTCLSQDIIAHETTHAILHGMHRRSIVRSNYDSLAFHEAFADIVALFQHFTMTDVVGHQIAHNRGTLRRKSLLTGLARQFGNAVGRRGSLRYALSLVEGQREADRIEDPDARRASQEKLPRYSETLEPHDRGGFLVAAVFDAFVTIYERRTADLLRMALGSSTPTGQELPPDLVNRLAVEAGKAADHVLRMCVRALDYIPPIDLHFGEYLRAMITADADLVPEDRFAYRVAMAEAFRKCGITVPGCMSMAPDSLMWEAPDPADLPRQARGQAGPALFAGLLTKLRLSQDFGSLRAKGRNLSLREQNVAIIEHNQRTIWEWLNSETDHDAQWERLLGVRMLASDRQPDGRAPLGSVRWTTRKGRKLPNVEVHSARVARRSGPDGQEVAQLVVQIAQRRAAFFDRDRQQQADLGKVSFDERDFWFRGGATLLVDLRDGRLRNVIRKRIDHEGRLEAERRFHLDTGGEIAMAVYGGGPWTREREKEPFAMVHRS